MRRGNAPCASDVGRGSVEGRSLGRSRVPAAHADGDHQHDADPDEHIADAEDVGEREPRRQGEDVGERGQCRVGHDRTVGEAVIRVQSGGRERLDGRWHHAAVRHDGHQVRDRPDRHQRESRDGQIAPDGHEDCARRRHIDRLAHAAGERLAQRGREEQDLDAKTDHGQPRPLEVELGEPLEPTADEDPDDDADRDGEEDEHARSAVSPERRGCRAVG